MIAEPGASSVDLRERESVSQNHTVFTCAHDQRVMVTPKHPKCSDRSPMDPRARDRTTPTVSPPAAHCALAARDDEGRTQMTRYRKHRYLTCLLAALGDWPLSAVEPPAP